jgi:hypothetical protein
LDATAGATTGATSTAIGAATTGPDGATQGGKPTVP